MEAMGGGGAVLGVEVALGSVEVVLGHGGNVSGVVGRGGVRR